MAKGSDSKAKSAYNAIGLTIYQSMDDTFAGKLDSTIDGGLLYVDPEDSDETDPMDIVEKIIGLVAKDTVTETIRKLVSMLKEIYICKRKSKESTAMFANRFQGLALKYLNHCNPTSSKQESQNFAMSILENANIPASVYSWIITQLVSKAKERSQDKDDIMLVAREHIENIKDDIQDLLEAYQNFKSSENLTIYNDENDIIMPVINRLQRKVGKTWKINNERDTKDRSNLRITLEDAVDALCEVKIELDTEKGNIDDIRITGTMLGKRSFGNMTERYDSKKKADDEIYRKRVYIPVGEGPKATSRCRNCKKVGHWWKDPECIYNKIR